MSINGIQDRSLWMDDKSSKIERDQLSNILSKVKKGEKIDNETIKLLTDISENSKSIVLKNRAIEIIELLPTTGAGMNRANRGQYKPRECFDRLSTSCGV